MWKIRHKSINIYMGRPRFYKKQIYLEYLNEKNRKEMSKYQPRWLSLDSGLTGDFFSFFKKLFPMSL